MGKVGVGGPDQSAEPRGSRPAGAVRSYRQSRDPRPGVGVASPGFGDSRATPTRGQVHAAHVRVACALWPGGGPARRPSARPFPGGGWRAKPCGGLGAGASRRLALAPPVPITPPSRIAVFLSNGDSSPSLGVCLDSWKWPTEARSRSAVCRHTVGVMLTGQHLTLKILSFPLYLGRGSCSTPSPPPPCVSCASAALT